eukprot:scaffold8405_cov117-Isochrysis_galbana.AAC.1
MMCLLQSCGRSGRASRWPVAFSSTDSSCSPRTRKCSRARGPGAVGRRALPQPFPGRAARGWPLCRCARAMSEAECAAEFNTDLVRRDFGGDVVTYLDAVMANAKAVLHTSSWGQFSLVPAVLPPILLANKTRDSFCAGIRGAALGFNACTLDKNALNTWALMQAVGRSFLHEYDLYTIVIPRCAELTWTWPGIAFVGHPGIVLNLHAYSLDPSFVHELGEYYLGAQFLPLWGHSARTRP